MGGLNQNAFLDVKNYQTWSSHACTMISFSAAEIDKHPQE